MNYYKKHANTQALNPNTNKPEPKRFGRKDAQDSQKIKILLLCFLPAPSAYECNARIQAMLGANAGRAFLRQISFRFEKNLIP
jgi:hypothetical protein